MNKQIVETIFPGNINKIKNKLCPTCNKKVGKFRNKTSEKEYAISGMCQDCQDSVFGVDE